MILGGMRVCYFLNKDKLNNKFEYRHLPINSVGIYVPGGNASFPSTVLMNAVPARVANLKRIVIINPSYKGNQNPAVLYAGSSFFINKSFVS